MEELVPYIRIIQIISVILSLTVTIITYRGYIRSHSQKMFLVSLGFFLIGIGIIIEGIMFEIFLLDIFEAHLIESVVILIALIIIYYALILQKEGVST